MILTFHITVALASIAFATWLFAAPTKAKLRTSYGFVSITLLSGFYLVASNPSHMVEACMTGLVYLGIVSLGIAGAHNKLALRASTVETRKRRS